jgi:hypothetical protein
VTHDYRNFNIVGGIRSRRRIGSRIIRPECLCKQEEIREYDLAIPIQIKAGLRTAEGPGE